MNSHDFVSFLEDELPLAVSGFYSHKVGVKLTKMEIAAIKNLLRPYKDCGVFYDFELSKKTFICLYKSIKATKPNLVAFYKQDNTVQREEFYSNLSKLMEGFPLDSRGIHSIKLKEVKFHFANRKSVKLSGYTSSLFFETLLGFVRRLKPQDFANIGDSIYGNMLFMFLNDLKDFEQKKTKRIKRKYSRPDYEPFHDKYVKQICKQIHMYLKNNSTLIDKFQTSKKELEFISDFIELTELHSFNDTMNVRNYIVRG